ncbi:MAG: hypothetical protein HYR72_02345 [Deltaproteobacteria bacterium]|nr:hypothetical protein [Deltaproteobacteria bacterium]MBI3387509.1 hypothetical protein [Deltaproteobacteria bacterium]
MRTFTRGVAPILVCLAVALRGAAAEEGPAQWLARIFDPATMLLEPFPGAQLNRKLSTDAIALERGGTKQIAVFIIPLDQIKAAADHYAKQFGAEGQILGADSPFEMHVFDFTRADAVARFKGLRVQISRSPFVDNKGEIKMEYQPPAK